MPDMKKEDDQARKNQKEKDQEETESQEDHHIPVPPSQHRHQKRHWEHLPDSKRKPVRSFKSPGRK